DEPAPVDVTIRKHHAPTGEAVAKEAKKGYDLLVVGVENTRVKNGGFHQDVSRIASALEGPLAIVAGSGDHLKHPQQSPLHILVPVPQKGVPRGAPDGAPALARAPPRPNRALYFPPPATSTGRRRRGFPPRQQEQAIMRDVVKRAARHDVTTRTAVHTD